jgi:ribonuclease HII
MYVYAGIDEAGYGPLLGPLVVARFVFAVPNLPGGHDTPIPQLWQRLGKSVCKRISSSQGRVVVNDSKKLKTKAAGIAHLERGVLSFAALAGHHPANVGRWLDIVGETCHRDLANLPWYAPSQQYPWQVLPTAVTPGEIAVARSMLKTTTKHIGIEVADLGAAVIFEDRFNRMVANTRSKASTNFTFVAAHLQSIWQQFGEHDPVVAVDRQSGRTHYREPLAQIFPEALLTVLGESDAQSSYRFTAGQRAMTVTFQTEAESDHMPVALASMMAKYTRELMMQRLNAWFTDRADNLKPTAGYATDGRRFLDEIQPHLADWQITREQLARIS